MLVPQAGGIKVLAQLTRRSFVRGAFLATAGIAITASCAHEIPTARVPRIGFLIGPFPTMDAAFRAELARLRYVEGQNLVIETAASGAGGDTLEARVVALSALKLDLVVAASFPAALEVRRVMPSMPMVVATAPGLVSNGFAQSLERPGGNVTGMDEMPAGLTGDRLRLLKAAAPGITRVALLSTTPGRGGHEMQVADAERVGGELGLSLNTYRVTSLPQLQQALKSMASDGVDGLLNFQGALSLVNRGQIISFAREQRIPAIYQSKLFADAGGLMALAPDQDEQFRVAARFVDKILNGASPGDLPIQHPARYFLTINRGTAAALGLQLPQSLLDRADSLIG